MHPLIKFLTENRTRDKGYMIALIPEKIRGNKSFTVTEIL